MSLYPIWAEVNLAAIAHNIGEVCRVIKPGTKVMVAVKANGYGHGAVEVAKTALRSGADSLAVARVNEALELRSHDIDCPILVLGYIPSEQYPEVINHNITPTLYSVESAQKLNQIALQEGQRVKVHIKVDTGMARLGFIPEEETVKEIKQLLELPMLQAEGIYTHFADADNNDKSYTHMQFARFMDFLDRLHGEGIDFEIRHAANSAAIIDLPETHLDMVRPGIMVYGLYPSPHVNTDRVKLRPAMTLKTRVGHVKEVDAGTFVSYGCSYCTPHKTTLATLPVGYADGFTRMLTKGEVLIHGVRAPVVGTICMDQCMVDVGHIKGVKPGDEVAVFGGEQRDAIPVEEVANKLGTINYEVICMVTARVPRLYIHA
ncbi:alanine racemase [Desulfofalx alkaliphila]|uniref:alanine racemase n=1 Tax=Desulfofalx alkaliphila TaxID=105483 RepID=UPI0004E146AF|nr:alanine racemase [Desulfofalx alkaliphila]